MATVILVRHGVTTATGTRLGGRTPTPLSDEGRAQAEDAADRLAGLALKAVYASPIVRTMQTAQPIARRHRLEVRELEGVQEFDYGSWTDRTFPPLRKTKLWATIMSTPSRVTFPGGEGFVEAQARAVAAIEQVVAQHADRATVAVVSHADIIKAVVAHFAGVPLDLFQRLVVSPASLTVLWLPKAGQPRLLRFNDTGALGGPPRAAPPRPRG